MQLGLVQAVVRMQHTRWDHMQRMRWDHNHSMPHSLLGNILHGHGLAGSGTGVKSLPQDPACQRPKSTVSLA